MGLFGTIGSALGMGDLNRSEDLYKAQGAYGQDINAAIAGLQRQAAGQDSLVNQQLNAALGRNVAAQQAMGATGTGNQALRARQAQQQIGNLRGGMAGDAAMARVAERQQAQQALAQMLTQLRGQQIQGAAALQQVPTVGQSLLGAGQGLGMAALLSDRAKKTAIRSAGGKADRLLDGLRAYSYRYKDQRHGKGEQLGVMAQDLQRAGLKQAVIQTPAGKAVDAGKLAGALAAAAARLHQRVRKLEAAG
mgnify:FL=1